MFTEPLSDFFSTAELATSALWSGSATPVRVIFDNGYAGIVFGSLEVASTGPVLFVRAADVPGIASGQTFTIGAAVYAVRNPERDETGALLLIRLTKL